MKFKRSSLILKLIVLVLVVYAAVTLVSLQSQIKAKRAESAALSQKISSAQQENDRLQDALDNVDSDKGVEQIARSKLGLVSQGEIVFSDVGQ